MDDIRLDKYLWAVRIFKTRSDAADAIRTNKVTVNDAYAKPSREVKIGDRIAVRKQQVTYSYKVLDLVSSRQPAKNVPTYCLNITPQEELDKLNVPRETIFVFRDRGTGRPTKKERRELDSLMEGGPLRRGGVAPRRQGRGPHPAGRNPHPAGRNPHAAGRNPHPCRERPHAVGKPPCGRLRAPGTAVDRRTRKNAGFPCGNPALPYSGETARY